VSAPAPGAAELAAWAEAALPRARAAFPGVEAKAAELAETARRRLEGDEAALPLVDGDGGLDAAELYLAAACWRGDERAVEALRERYFVPVEGALGRMGLGAAHRDDVWQTLCQRLLVGEDGAPPRLVHYAGGGTLGGLVRVAATRLGLSILEQEKRTVATDALLEQIAVGSSGPELGLMKQQHRHELKQEVEAAIGDLSTRERLVLRLHLVEQVGIDAIAAAQGVHRATAARWVASAKEALGERVRARLSARWRVGDASLPALRTLVDSQLDLSLGRLLAVE
jgi:RNA polymerase sigma-70 factor (ECF subfamily)